MSSKSQAKRLFHQRSDRFSGPFVVYHGDSEGPTQSEESMMAAESAVMKLNRHEKKNGRPENYRIEYDEFFRQGG